MQKVSPCKAVALVSARLQADLQVCSAVAALSELRGVVTNLQGEGEARQRHSQMAAVLQEQLPKLEAWAGMQVIAAGGLGDCGE
jgi:hypothetical protein